MISELQPSNLIIECFFAIQRNNEQIIRTQDKMNMELTGMKNKMTGIERKQEETKVGQDLKFVADLLCNFQSSL